MELKSTVVLPEFPNEESINPLDPYLTKAKSEVPPLIECPDNTILPLPSIKESIAASVPDEKSVKVDVNDSSRVPVGFNLKSEKSKSVPLFARPATTIFP